MRPLEELSATAAKRLDGLLFDLDDTLLSRGVLTEPTYSSLFRLQESGMQLVGVTGRPAGWGDVLARQWPVLGIVSENGALASAMRDGSFERMDPLTGEARRVRRERLASLVAAMLTRFPDLTAADDVDARVSDFAFDIGEHRSLQPAHVSAAAAFARERGARTTTSSVHLHVSFDGHDKASGSLSFLRTRLGLDPTLARWRFAYVGDSQNDAACFAAFPVSFGVANLAPDVTFTPRFRTRAGYGDGFAELAARLVQLRAGDG